MDSLAREYESIVNELDNNVDKNTGQVCTICFEEYKEDRQQVAFGPCRHSACNECTHALPMVEIGAGRNRKRTKLCPFCRADIKTTISLFNN